MLLHAAISAKPPRKRRHEIALEFRTQRLSLAEWVAGRGGVGTVSCCHGPHGPV